jgi:hypothetical protein
MREVLPVLPEIAVVSDAALLEPENVSHKHNHGIASPHGICIIDIPLSLHPGFMSLHAEISTFIEPRSLGKTIEKRFPESGAWSIHLRGSDLNIWAKKVPRNHHACLLQ